MNLFVRLVLGITSQDERLAGLDTSIRWNILPNGRKGEGWITVESKPKDGPLQVKKYKIVKAPMIRFSIRGRATTTWTVEDPQNKEKICLKDYWRAEDRQKELVFLEVAKKLEGVCHYYDYVERACTAEFHGGAKLEQHLLHRHETRVIMQAYGAPIDHFKSPKQMLEALRDAINGEFDGSLCICPACSLSRRPQESLLWRRPAPRYLQ